MKVHPATMTIPANGVKQQMSPASTSSSGSTTTPRTNNYGAMGGAEALQQPILGTIQSTGSASSIPSPVVTIRKTSPVVANPRKSTDAAPRDTLPEASARHLAEPPAMSNPFHRRWNSEEFGYYQGSYGSGNLPQYPPAMLSNSYGSIPGSPGGEPQSMNYPMYPQGMGQGMGPPPPQPPPPRMRSSSSGSMQDRVVPPRPTHSRQHSSSSDTTPLLQQRHRRSHSYSSALTSEPDQRGFWQSERAVSPSFSPRNELMGLTQSLRPSPNSSPRQQPSPKRVYNSYHTWNAGSTGSSLLSSSDRLYSGTVSDRHLSERSSAGGEAVFLTRKRHESSRKRHMRQQSAQLWVEDVKGVEQPLACRNVAFLLFFVFHLVFLMYLSNKYSYEAIRDVNGVPTAGVDDDTLPTVTVYYTNLLYIACLSGAFAVVLSSILLLVMTIFARYFVQVILIVIISLSFIWGTAGIGLSAKSIVPISGIIALALTVAYAFIVWDRVPFASANLQTALTAVKDHPGTLVIAFCLQVASMAWLIYYGVLALSLYDAIETGELDISHQWEVVVYVLLGLSFFWTYQVSLVSSRAGSLVAVRPLTARSTEYRSSIHRWSYWQLVASSGRRVGCSPIVLQDDLLFDGLNLLWKSLCCPSPSHSSAVCVREAVKRRVFAVVSPRVYSLHSNDHHTGRGQPCSSLQSVGICIRRTLQLWLPGCGSSCG